MLLPDVFRVYPNGLEAYLFLAGSGPLSLSASDGVIRPLCRKHQSEHCCRQESRYII